ncbi:DUF5134 domain-containing protein [Gulosibacter sp. 10]|uniref:DUF5134 domain-containing protein n=1 Tax=Gulosibacter sp. 10 TaxID=1255570 RepID=UPI00097F39C4|nr:DUF5134 domain-containing protein [Gulosibacter sp. 10]SJM63636.1 integral membrane protein [Gulosibacter sp. 10]
MFEHPVAQWGFTLVFVLLLGYSAVRAFVDRAKPVQTIGHALHGVMAADMAMMSWPWWMDLPGSPQTLFFSVATLWFLGMFVLQAGGRLPRRIFGGHGAAHQAAHVAMMLAMVWMVVVMSGSQPSQGGHDHGSMSVLAALTGVVVVVALLVSGVIFVVEFADCVRGAGKAWLGHTGDMASGAVMCLSMAAMCLPMLVQ